MEEACYRPQTKGEGVNVFLKPLEEAWVGQGLVLLGAINFPITCWKGSMVGHMQSWTFLEGARNNFLLRSGWARPGGCTDGSAVPAKEATAGVVVTHGSIGYGEHERVEMKNPRGVREEHHRAQTWGTGQVACGLSREWAAGIIGEQV